MSATKQQVYEYVQLHQSEAICALALPVDGRSGKFTYYDIHGGKIPRGVKAGSIEKLLVTYDEAQTAAATYDGACIAYFYAPENKWLVVGNGLSEQLKAKFAAYSPFTDVKPPAARFPVDALPELFKGYCEAAATSYQVDPAMSACCVLATLSAIFQKCDYRVQISPDWGEPINLYLITSALPSERKSPVLRDAISPLTDVVEEWNEEQAEQIEWEQKHIEVLKRKVDNLTTMMSKPGKRVTESDLKAAQHELREAEKNMTIPQNWLVDDTTPEALAEVLRDNQEVAALLSGEGGSILGILAGRYTAPGTSANLDLFLKGYTVEPYTVHRVTRQTIKLKRPRVTVLLMAQPSLLTDFLNNDSFRERGLCGRFLYCFPQSHVGSRTFISTPVPPKVRTDYENTIRGLADYVLNWVPEDKTLTVSAEASEVLKAYHDEVEPRRPEMSEAMQAWSGKIEGSIIRIAALIYLAQHNGQAGEIDGDTMRGAVSIGRYFETCAEYAFGTAKSSKSQMDALVLLKKLKSEDFTSYRKDKYITRKELFDRVKGTRFPTVESMHGALKELTEHGYIYQMTRKDGKAGRPSPVILFNPEAFERSAPG